MKRLLLFALLLCVAPAFSKYYVVQEAAMGEKPFMGDARPGRRISIGRQALQVLEPGTQSVEIVIAGDASRTVRYAAEELQRLLGRRLSTRIPIVQRPSAEKTSLILGINAWSRAAGIKDGELCRDGFIIRSVGRDVYIVGRDDPHANLHVTDRVGGVWGNMNEHATLFGVYDFLERFGQVRFYFPSDLGIVVPVGTALSLPAIDIFDRPDCEARNVSVYAGIWGDEKNLEKAKLSPFESYVSPSKNKYSRMLRLQTKYIPNCHGLRALKLVDRFGQSHPEYFALLPDGHRHNDPAVMHTGHLCYNSGVMDVIKGDALAILRNQPPSTRGVSGNCWLPTEQLPGRVFGFMPQDGYRPCTCSACKSIFQDPQKTSNFMWGKTAEMGRFVRQEMGPGYYVSQMAYHPYDLIPDVEIPDNVLVMVATKGPWSKGFPDTLRQGNELIKGWTEKIHGKVWLWNYAGKYGRLNMPGIPATTPRAIGEFYKAQRGLIYGAFLESETDKTIFNYLGHYVFGKVMWDASVDVDALLKEHYALMFGQAASVMESIFVDIEDTWINRIGGRTLMTSLGPVGAPPSAMELWTRIYSSERLAKMSAQFDEAERLTSGDEWSNRRVKYIRQEFLGTIQEHAAAYLKRNNTQQAFRFHLPTKVYLQAFRTKDPLGLKTSVSVRLEGDRLVVVFDCDEPEMDKVKVAQRPHDDADIWQDNSVEVFLDVEGQGKGFYQLMVNSAGSFTDQYCKAIGGNTQIGLEWESRAEVRVKTTAMGWQARLSIPVDSFHTPLNQDGFKANFTRSRILPGQQQLYSWSPFMRQRFHELENFGTLCPQAATSTNLIKNMAFNGTMEGRGIGQWTWAADRNLPPSHRVSLDDSTFIFGTQSVKISISDPTSKRWNKVTQCLGVLKPNTTYRVSYFVRLDQVVPSRNNGGVNLNIGHDKNYWFPMNRLTGTLPWLYQSFVFTTVGPEHKRPTYLNAFMVNCTGTAWFDGVTLEELPRE